MVAIMEGNNEIVDYFNLLNINIDIDDHTQLLKCIEKNDNIETLQLLIKYGLDVSKYYHEILNLCMTKNFVKIAQLLICQNIKSNINDNNNVYCDINDDINLN